MPTVRSRRLWAGRFTDDGGYWVVYTVPPGIATILKTINAKNWGTAGAQLQVFVRTTDTLELVGIRESGAAVNETYSFETWTVLHPGDQVVIQPHGGAMDVWVSGSELQDGVPTGPPEPPTPLPAGAVLPVSP